MEIKRCLCGGDALLVQEMIAKYNSEKRMVSVGWKYYVECTKCEAITNKYIDENDAIEEWNKENAL